MNIDWKKLLLYFFETSILFLAAASIGYLVAITFDISIITKSLETDVNSLRSNILAINTLSFFFKVFINNTLISFIIISSSIFRTRYIPTFFLMFNGFVIAIQFYTLSTQLGSYIVVAGLISHGIIEIPALVVATTFSWYAIDKFREFYHNNVIGGLFSELTSIRDRKWKIDIKNINKNIFEPFFYVITPMLFISALIETFVSPQIFLLLLS